MADGAKRAWDDRLPHIQAAEQALLNGRSERAVVKAMIDKFGITGRQAREDIAVVKRHWAKRAEKIRANPGAAFGKALERREALYLEAVDSADYGLALTVERDRCNLLGLYPDKKVVVTDGRPKQAADLSDADLEAIASAGRVTDNDDTSGGGGGSAAAAAGPGGAVSVHDVHDAEVRSELAPPPVLPPPGPVGDGGVPAVDDLHAAASREVGAGI